MTTDKALWRTPTRALLDELAKPARRAALLAWLGEQGWSVTPGAGEVPFDGGTTNATLGADGLWHFSSSPSSSGEAWALFVPPEGGDDDTTR